MAVIQHYLLFGFCARSLWQWQQLPVVLGAAVFLTFSAFVFHARLSPSLVDVAPPPLFVPPFGSASVLLWLVIFWCAAHLAEQQHVVLFEIYP